MLAPRPVLSITGHVVFNYLNQLLRTSSPIRSKIVLPLHAHFIAHYTCCRISSALSMQRIQTVVRTKFLSSNQNPSHIQPSRVQSVRIAQKCIAQVHWQSGLVRQYCYLSKKRPGHPHRLWILHAGLEMEATPALWSG